MNHQKLVEALTKPGADILATMTPRKMNLLHMAIGISGEAGELLEGQVESQGDDVENFIEEMGDLEFYFEGLRAALNLSIDVRAPVETMYDASAILVVQTNASKVLDLVKKHVIYDKDLAVSDICAEMQLLTGYMTQCYLAWGVTREDAINANIAKLKIRYGEKYSDKAAHDRVDKETSH